MATKQNIEYDTLLHCSPVLTTQIAADPQAVSLELVAKGLIPPSLQGSAQQPAGERANALVQQILNKVKDFPRNFKVFMDILAKFPWLQDVVQLVNDESRAQRQDAEHPSGTCEKKFPYLKAEMLTDQQGQDLKAQLTYESQEIKKKYAILVGNTIESLQNRNITVGHLIVTMKDSHAKTIVKRMEKETSGDLIKALHIISEYWSFFDYDLLSIIIKGHCGKDSNLQSSLSSYESEFKKYCQRRLCEIPADTLGAKMDGDHQYFTIKLDDTAKNITEVTGFDIKVQNKRLTSILGTNVCLKDFKDGCIEFVYIAADEDFTINDQQKKKLSEIGVKKIYSNTKVSSQLLNVTSKLATGYKCNFVSVPDDTLKCLICSTIARDPWQHGKCGRLFCEECLNKHGKEKPCPNSNCRMKNPQYMEDARSKKNVYALRVKCDNVERGCEWEGSVGTLEEHVDTCGFTPVPCPNGCTIQGDVIRLIMKKNLNKHLKDLCMKRAYKCQHCGLTDTYDALMHVHEDECPMKPLSCFNPGCSKKIRREKMDKHEKYHCQYAVISCKYKNIGCDVKMKRKDMGAHEQDDKVHLHQALNTVVKLQDNLQSATETIASMKKEMKEAIKSVKKENDNRSVQLRLAIGTVKNELAQKVFKLTQYEKKKNTNEIYNSQSFFTSTDGYKMQIKVYPDGNDDGEGTHVSVFVHILKGDNDDNLKWPFIGSVQLELLNQLEDKNHHLMILSLNAQENNARAGDEWGFSEFIHHSKLPRDRVNNIQYLKDDTLYFRVSVEVSGHKPWLECTLK